jgi:hypothetical protein
VPKLLYMLITASIIAVAGPSVHPAQADEPLLSIETPDGVAHHLDRAALEVMPRETFSTTSIWTKGVHEYAGVPLKGLLAAQGIASGMVRAVALNDYAVEIPVEALGDAAPIVADRIDGATFGPRDKGPLWIVYPYDSDTKYQSETAYGRSVWQLTRLVAR